MVRYNYLEEDGTLSPDADGEYIRYEDVKDDLEKLMYLEAHGVDNWEGYDFAMENMRDEEM